MTDSGAERAARRIAAASIWLGFGVYTYFWFGTNTLWGASWGLALILATGFSFGIWASGATKGEGHNE